MAYDRRNPHCQRGCNADRWADQFTRLEPINLPQLGQTFTVGLAPQPPGLGFLLTGWSNTTAPFGALPLDLSFLWMPGCALRMSSDLVLSVSSNPARAYLPIPNNAVLAGFVFHQQAMLADPAANTLGVVLSDAATAVIGR